MSSAGALLHCPHSERSLTHFDNIVCYQAKVVATAAAATALQQPKQHLQHQWQ